MKIQEKTNKIFQKLKQKKLQIETDLIYTNAYTLLVAVVLSAQSTDIGVNKATQDLFKNIDNPIQMLALGEKKLIEHIKTIGLYKNKAKNVIALSRILIDQYNSKIPSTMEKLITLPGVGRKTANVILNVVFDYNNFKNFKKLLN